MSRKNTSPRPSEGCGCGDLHPAPFYSRKGDWFGRFGSSRIPATAGFLTPVGNRRNFSFWRVDHHETKPSRLALGAVPTRATVVLPDYLEPLNDDLNYQLTVIGQLAQAVVVNSSESSESACWISKQPPAERLFCAGGGLLWGHPKIHVAGQRAVGRNHFHFAGGRARGNSGCDFRTRNHVKGRCSPVKGDAGRARQIGSQNLDVRAYRAGSGQCLHERGKAHAQAEDRAIVAGPAVVGDPVEGPICVVNQRGIGAVAVSTVEAVERGQRAPCGDAKDGATGLTE